MLHKKVLSLLSFLKHAICLCTIY
uniref:Uncharacterized protein n=1 Tax=Anguilla anguilla TaxID=7936 RepID=A0A0E9PEE2_ANGAN